MTSHVAVVGAGLSGAACAAALAASGIRVDVLERGRAPGGRLASPVLHGRRVDLGAAYFTAKDDRFAAVVRDWLERGVVREWTDTFEVLSPDGRTSTTGPMRYGTPAGLRSLARDLLAVEPTLGAEVRPADLDRYDAVVLAMPDPQAARLLPGAAVVESLPVISVAAGWSHRQWDLTDAAFVNDDPDLTLVADDGSRRGDGAAVLVAHATHTLAAAHLDDPDAAVAPALAALRRLLGVTAAPQWTHAHRWSFAKPAGTHGTEPFGLQEHGGRLVGLCNDSWCPDGQPRVESAWLSGTRLGEALAARLT